MKILNILLESCLRGGEEKSTYKTIRKNKKKLEKRKEKSKKKKKK